ncbi:MAG: HypC/HybG/HupF family hydrogenase formation chaperone [Candidatus Omnitrophica bacterium]|nr:HypC/HybG/HupF family hydrogenase formation chaperone [Candidatus Omnitrophota bacterium]
MCLAVPGKIEKIFKDNQALVDFMGVKKKVALDLLENVNTGDFIIVHAGFAISRLSEKDANETIGYFRQIAENT